MSDSVPHLIRPPRASCTRLIPPVAFLLVTVLCTLLNTADLTLRWPYVDRKPPGKSGMHANSKLMRSTGSRDALLAQARETLEYWWYLKGKEAGESSGRCPFSAAPWKRLPPREQVLEYYDVTQDIDVMEAMGFGNLTTCGGIYPRYKSLPAKVGSPSDKIQTLLASVDIEADSDNATDLVTAKFCYPPTFRPPTSANVHTVNGSAEVKLTSSPEFCPRLLQLYRDIVAGAEPPLLTLFTYIPDPIEDPAKVSRRFLALNLDLFKPFVQPVLVTDRRMVMAVANSIRWPCLPVKAVSPDNLPVFRPLSQAVMNQFNSTFYGFVRGVSIFDASLLETLLEVKEKFAIGKEGAEDVVLYGSALYKQDQSFRSDYSAVGTMAKSRGMWNWPDKASSLTYFFHTRQSFSDLPPLAIEDKNLVPFLVERSEMLGHRVIDASNTILSVYNVHLQNTNEWDRILLPSPARNQSYNQVLGSQYLKSLRKQVPGHQREIRVAKFDSEGNVLFEDF